VSHSSLEPSKTLALITVPGILADALGAGIPATGHQHPIALYYQPTGSYALLAGDRSDPLHNEPASEFIHLENAPIGGTVSATRGPQVWPGGLT
jgi:hypothetical protein